MKKVGFIGFGEVASVLSKRFIENGCSEIFVFDILISDQEGMEKLKKRAQTDKITFASVEETIEKSDYILSTVTTQVAGKVAKECAKYLKQGKTYIDLNSTSPSVKVDISKIIIPTGADFVEGAILGAIGATGADTKILLGGEHTSEASAALNEMGLNTSCFSSEIGKASTFKMLRSIYSKGMEALLLELLIAGKHAGLDKELWNDIIELMSKTPFEKTASNWVKTHVLACERRYYEMIQVVDTMQEIGVEPVITRGTLDVFKRSTKADLSKRVKDKPGSIYEVLELMSDL